MCPKSSYRLKNGFYPLHFMAAILSHRWDSSLLSHQLAKRLCVTCVMFLFGADKASVGRVTHYLVYAFFCDMQAAFLGRFIALESSLHWLSVKRIKAVEKILNR